MPIDPSGHMEPWRLLRSTALWVSRGGARRAPGKSRLRGRRDFPNVFSGFRALGLPSGSKYLIIIYSPKVRSEAEVPNYWVLWTLRVRVQRSGLKVHGIGFRVLDSGFGVGFRVQGLGYRLQEVQHNGLLHLS